MQAKLVSPLITNNHKVINGAFGICEHVILLHVFVKQILFNARRAVYFCSALHTTIIF